MRLLTLLVMAVAPLFAQIPAPKPTAEKTLTDGMSVRGKYVTLLVGADPDKTSPGGIITLSVRITPGPKIHVYAPGQQGYMPVAMAVKKDPAFRPRPVVYPPAKPYAFVPLGETVQVYSAPFVLRQDLVLATSADLTARAASGDTLTVVGTLAYQACDDKVCYRPETLPIEWKVPLKALVR